MQNTTNQIKTAIKTETKLSVVLKIQKDIALQVLPFAAIASKHNVSIHDVNLVWLEMCEQENA